MEQGAAPPVCLIRPPAVEAFRFATTSITPPLGLAYIAGTLEAAGHDFSVIDAVALAPKKHTRYYKGYLVGLPLADIAARIPGGTKIVGISVVFTHEWPAVVRLIALIKALLPDVTIILGGEHISAMPEFSLATSQGDIVVMGEGEETILQLLHALADGGALDAIDGIAFRKDGRIEVNKRRARRAEVDAIARPAWQRFDLRAYHDNRFFGGMYSPHLTVPVLATRGCPYQCTYCSSPNMWTPSWVPRSPALVADEIEYYVREYGARNFPFQDLTAIIKKEWIVSFCKEIIRRKLGITWQLPTGTRSEAIDAEVAELLRDSGMVSMAYAPESGSETTRELIKKKMKTERLFESLKAAVEARLNVAVYLVIGFPHDTKAHLAENLPFIDRLVETNAGDLAVGFYMALPGTELFRSLYDHGKITIDKRYFCHILANTSLIPVASYAPALSLAQLFFWKLRFFLRFYVGKFRAKSKAGAWAAAKKMLSGFGRLDHESKLQSALANGLKTGCSSLVAQFRESWIPRREEEAFFAGWDAIYRRIHDARKAQHEIISYPKDTAELHRHNVAALLKKEHAAFSLAS